MGFSYKIIIQLLIEFKWVAYGLITLIVLLGFSSIYLAIRARGGMTVMPGDMVHMDMHGVVKFPASKMEEVLARAKRLLEEEKEQAATFRDPKFLLEKWKAKVRSYETVVRSAMFAPTWRART